MLDKIVSAGSSLLGGLFGNDDAKKNRELQREFAQNTVQWRVEDAKKAGLHPLYALGHTGASYNPVSSPMGQAISDAGNAISKGVSNAYEKELQKLNLENVRADIKLKESQSLGYIADAKRASNIAMSGMKSNGANDKTMIGGTHVDKNKGWSDAEDIETRYGDLVSWLYGIGVIGADTIENLPRIEAWQEKNRRERDKRNYNRPYEGNIGRNGKIIGF